MPASADIYTERENWQQPLAWSVALHGLLFASMLIYGAIFGRFSGESWGGAGSGGGAMSATMVSTIPLPHAPTQTQNILANESKGLTQSLPKVKEEPTPEAIPIPEKDTKRRPERKPHTSTQQKPPPPVEEPSNVVPFGQGGPVSGPYGVFSAANAKGGFGFNGGSGDFGSRFAWYVRVVQQKVSENWLKYEIDPNIQRCAPGLHHLRNHAQRAAGQRADRAIQRRAVAGPVGGARAAAHRLFRALAQ